jgi:hypothetical protein
MKSNPPSTRWSEGSAASARLGCIFVTHGLNSKPLPVTRKASIALYDTAIQTVCATGERRARVTRPLGEEER